MDPRAVPSVDRAYHGGTTDPTLLDFSHNTYPERPPGTTAVYDTAFAASRRYPSDDYTAFRTAAGAYLGREPQHVVPTAGSLPALRLALGVTVPAGSSVLVPEPSFGEYDREVRLQGATPEYVPAETVIDADPTDHAAAIVCNPNNPTGRSYEVDALVDFAERCRDADATLVVDEAFLDFTDYTTMAEVPGTVVLRSLTKIFGLPGLRSGFAVATGDLLDRLERARASWAMSTPAADVGAHCLRQTQFVERVRERTAEERERLRDGLSERFDVLPSDAPYLLCRVRGESVDDVLEEARAAGIVIRDARTFRTLDEHLRVAVKRRHENRRLVDALVR
jgi:L-threonine-O-3-phosphate decarboxylase